MGCTLESINRFAYPELPEEAQILWRVEPVSYPTRWTHLVVSVTSVDLWS